jgi:hypothetical protein
MRAAIPPLAAALVILGASAAMAAPTCVDRHGVMARCGAAGAMPVGWTPPPDVLEARRAAAAAAAAGDNDKLVGLTIFLAGFFALIALMPDFEGKWDRQASDDEQG